MKTFVAVFIAFMVVTTGVRLKGDLTASGQSREMAAPQSGDGGPAMDLPMVRITVTDGGIWAAPELPAGRYRVLLDNLTDRPITADFIRLVDGWTPERLKEAVRGEVADPNILFGELRLLHQDLATLTFGGGVAAEPHTSGQAVLDLTRGQWVVTSLESGPGSPFATIDVTPGDSTFAQVAVPADADLPIEIGAFVAAWSGPAGALIVHLHNATERPSGMVILGIPSPGFADPAALRSDSGAWSGRIATGLISPGARNPVDVTLDSGR
ncbi:MAG: hypothetical protein IT336_02240 [Thermomicrobiales bacterium]|nr:hypothetical protein [Thermomicrobiales bacterium]